MHSLREIPRGQQGDHSVENDVANENSQVSATVRERDIDTSEESITNGVLTCFQRIRKLPSGMRLQA